MQKKNADSADILRVTKKGEFVWRDLKTKKPESGFVILKEKRTTNITFF